MHFSLDENERKRSLNLSEKVVLRTSETSAIEQPLKTEKISETKLLV